MALGGSVAMAGMVEGLMQSGTDPVQSHLFSVNPAILIPQGTQGGVAVGRHLRSVKLDQSSRGDEVIANEVQEDHLGANVLVDLGAGTGLGAGHQIMYRKVETSLRGERQNDIELMKEQQSAVRLIIELITELHVAMSLRYLYQDTMLIGSPQLGPEGASYFRTTMVGYGAGAVYRTKTWSLAYAYFPPMRGKTDVGGEEKILVESGEIDMDASLAVHSSWTLGLAVKRWIHELDDRKDGTTARDDQTAISLYGLDVDQYLFAQQQAMLGVRFAKTKELAFSFALGQEQGEFNFRELRRYGQLAVQQRSRTNPKVATNRASLFVHYANQGVELEAGLRMFTRKLDFSSQMGGASYDATGRDMVATIGMKL